MNRSGAVQGPAAEGGEVAERACKALVREAVDPDVFARTKGSRKAKS